MANSNGWGDGASNNLIGWGQGADNAIGWGDSHLKSWAGATDIAGFDSAAISYFNATGISGATQQDAIDNLIRGLKEDGIWSKMKAVYPFVTDNRNLLGYTEDFSNSLWTKSETTIASNSVIAPNGTLTADRLSDSVNNTVHYCVQTTNQKANRYNYSIYLKYLSRKFVAIDINDGTSGIGIVIDIQNGTYIGTMSVGTGFTLNSYAITSEGNGWYKCSVDVTFIGSGSASAEVVLRNSNTTSWGNSYSGNGSGVYMWGAQLELGSTATTYQPIATTQQAFIANQFKYNLVNPLDTDAAFRLVFNGGWTHSSTGATPNGTNGYADTFLTQISMGMFNNSHMSYYARTVASTSGTKVEMGVGTGLVNSFSNLATAFSGVMSVNSGSRTLSQSVTDARGFVVNNSTSSSLKLYKNGTLINSDTSTQLGTPSSFQLRIGAQTGGALIGNYTDRQCAFSSIGDGLTDTEAANLYTRVQAFQTALNRQIP